MATCWFCIDIEASGPVPALFSMLSIGASVVREREGKHVVEDGDFYLELKPAFARVDAEALKVAKLDLEKLARDGVPAREALARLRAFVDARRGRDRVVFVGHNAPFDWSYINYYFHHCEVPNPFGYAALDTKALAMGVLDIPWEHASKEVLERLVSLPPQDEKQIHNAGYDARYQALILCALLDHPRRKAGLGDATARAVAARAAWRARPKGGVAGGGTGGTRGS